MKNFLFSLFVIALSYKGVAQTSINMCSTTNSTSVLTGTLYDSGGPFGSYLDYENCQLLISPGCQATITLVFTQFQTESCCDPMSIYNGTSTSAPLLGTYAGNSLPPTIVANSGSMFIKWNTDGSVVSSGYVATWTAVVSGTVAPVANFTMNPAPMLNVPFQFTDLTTNLPNQWFWQFGDATTSTLPNPIKTYTSSGLKTITLTATNCNSSASVTNTLMVQSAPSISIDPTVLTATSMCGGSATVPLNVYNTGSGPLSFSISGNSSSQVNVLAITNYVDMTQEYPTMIAGINTYFTNYTVTQHFLTNVPAFQAALAGKQVLLIPEQESYAFGFMQTYSATINSFVSSGGIAILCGSGNMNQINDIGLFTCTSITNVGSNLTVVDTSESFMTTIPMGIIPSTSATWYSTFTNTGNTDYVKFGTSNVVTKRNIGVGKAIYLGFDYFSYTNHIAKMLANSIKYSSSFPTWLSTSFSSATVAPSSSTSVTFTFNTTNMPAGNYTFNLVVNSNDPSVPSLTVPVSYTIYGAPSVSVSANCINFGTIMQFTNKLDSITIYNNGCATLSVTSMNTTNSVYTYTPNTSYTVAAWANKKIKVNFNPLTAGSFIDTLYIFTNDINKKICLSGNATTAPSISVSPASLSATLPACNATQTMLLNVYNMGGPNLVFSTSSSNQTGTVNVLAITNYVDMTTEYPNTISAINTYFTNYTLTQHNLTSVPAFQAALTGMQVLLIPEQESYFNGFMQTYSTTIQNFVSSGGIAILCGTGNLSQVNDVGLFNSTSVNWLPSTLTVIDTNDVIMKTLPMGNIFPPNATMYNTFTNSGITDYVKFNSASVVCKRSIGSGKAIFMGFDYFSLDVNSSKMIANSVKSALSSVSWLSSSPNSATVAPSSSTTITYTFNTGNLTAGTYTYNVIINSNDPTVPNYTVPVTLVVGNNPCANFSFTNPNNCTGVVTFTQNCINTVTSYSWNFGNSTSSTQQNPTCNYTSPGTYTVTLTACNGTLCSTISKTLSISNVGGPITAACSPTNMYYSTNYGILNVTFNTINNISSLTYIEGGYKDFSCTNQTSVTVGSSYVLKVSTNSSYNENVSVWIDFDNNGSFSASEQVIQSLNTLVTHSINFTPPVTAVQYTPLRMRVIDEANSYNILNACSSTSYGQTEDYAVTILPNNVPPVVNFNESINSCQGTVAFTDMSTNNPTSWQWNFGNSAVSIQQNPIYTYTVPGTYTVTLVATNQFGSSFFSKVITVNPLAFTIGYTPPQIINQPITFTTNLSGGASYVWDFGDGNFGGTQTAFNTYTASGTYVVKLTIVYGSCVNTMSTTIVIGNPAGLKTNSSDFSIQVYPNPFKGETKINLSVANGKKVNVELFNSIGQKVDEVRFENIKPGVNEFSLKNIPAGIYFLKVNHGESEQTFKLISYD